MDKPHPIDINLLPARYRPRQVTVQTAAAVVAAAALLFGLMPAYAALRNAQARTAALEASRQSAEDALNRMQINQSELLQVTEQIEQTRSQIDEIRAQRESLGQGGPSRSAGVEASLAAADPSVRLLAIELEGNVITLRGAAERQEAVLSYSYALKASGRFANVLILSIVNEDEYPDVTFIIRLEL